MFEWLRRFVRPSVGDRVRVTEGPYAGQTGTIDRVAPGPRFVIFIDECCQPLLAAHHFRRLNSGRNLGQAIRASREAEPISEEGRATAEIRDWVDSVSP